MIVLRWVVLRNLNQAFILKLSLGNHLKTMKFRPQNCLRSSEDHVGRDRLSELPDEVIVHILSCMPTLDAVRTVLIRRFGNLWTLVHTLNFDINEFLDYFFLDEGRESDDVGRFNLFVRNVLVLHKRPSIHKLHLCVEFDSYDEHIKAVDDIRLWLRFALDRQAKEIKFCDKSKVQVICRSILPNFNSQSLVTLELGNCELEPQLQVNSGSLKKLLLDDVTLYDYDFERFLSGCPSLQELRIVNPFWMKKLSFTAPNIDKLSLVLTSEYLLKFPLLLDCPNLKRLEIDGCIPDMIDVASVRDIYIKQFICCTDDDDELSKHKMFLRKIEGVEVFRLSCNASERFLHTIPYFHLLQIRWKCIVLELQMFSQSCVVGVFKLMRSLGHLEELIIYSTEDFKANTDLLSSDELEISSPCVAPQLKTITLHGYGKSWKSQLQLVEFLLKSAAVLDKLVIVPNPIKHRLTGGEELEFVERVSSFPKASTSAKVVFA